MAHPEALVAAALLLAGGLLLALLLRRRRRSRRTRGTQEHRRFVEASQRRGLSDDEVQRLELLLRHDRAATPSAVFDSVALFERCVHAAVRELVPASMSSEQLKAENEVLSSLRRKLGYDALPLEHPLVSTRNISVGQTGALVAGDSHAPLVPRAAVVANDEFTFKVQYDVERDDSYHLFPSNDLRFVFSRRNDASYVVPLTVAEYDDTGVLAAFHTLEISRSQLRQHARIEVNLPLRCQLVGTAAPERSEVKVGQAIEARMLDLSGGGLSFASVLLLRPGDSVTLTFSIPSGGFNGIAARVLRVGLHEGKGQVLYSHHVEFSEPDPASRELIVRYVYQRQRQMDQWQ